MRFPNRETAEFYAARWKAREPKRLAKRCGVYFCLTCGRYHIGHLSIAAYRAREARKVEEAHPSLGEGRDRYANQVGEAVERLGKANAHDDGHDRIKSQARGELEAAAVSTRPQDQREGDGGR